MERNLLVTIGDDLNSLYGARFVASFFARPRDTGVTLLYIAPRFESRGAAERTPQRSMDAKLSQLYLKRGRRALEVSRQILESYDFSPRRIATRLVSREHGMARDILREAEEGKYHALVLGKRGYSVFRKSLQPGLPEEMVKGETSLPVWVCKHPRRGLKNILLCLDGSQASLSVADHAGFMAAGEERHGITLFHVSEGGAPTAEDIFREAEEILASRGVEKNRMARVLVKAERVAKAIEGEAREGGYAVVAVGRKGERSGKSPVPVDSRSVALIDMLDRSALWVGG